ncbi:MAG: response regulator transcription factor [Rothia sp. (in: high G+C Gram-positive bacteria)]|uniref:response regulator transcription factor n=1 Tax=Rothia sp. (in: high G+C Gram-positive bacteria) TaxID=1885016 RepID=UPI0026E00EA0|nr:response regulator transcription factor [Rothia sp. (in: high G+C Gram-positive bacteria)]MDO5750112.1 response regulator transcription factor [Rothia sp. (in: high G+C Gram-positive bacteria)]
MSSTHESPTILLVEDNDELSEMLSILLAQEGYNTVTCENGGRAFDEFMRHTPDLVLLDIMLPDKDGIEVCQEIRAASDVPIIMLTAKTETKDVVRGLEVGADDYMAKPFKFEELFARIRTRLRPRESRQLVVRVGDAVVDMDGRTVHYGDTEIMMTPTEFDLLVALLRRPGQAISRSELLHSVWGYDEPNDPLVSVHMQRLRAKFDEVGAPAVIQTVRGIGYKIPSEAIGAAGGAER